LTPTIIQLKHALKNHKHKICTSIEVQHIHEQGIDCSVFHLQLKTPSLVFLSNTELEIHPQYINPFIKKSQKKGNTFIFKKNPRGPPVFIV